MTDFLCKIYFELHLFNEKYYIVIQISIHAKGSGW